MSCPPHGSEKKGEDLCHAGIWGYLRFEKVLVVLKEKLCLSPDMAFQAFPDVPRLTPRGDEGKIPLQDKVRIPQGCWLPTDGEITEEFIERLGVPQVVVRCQGLEPEGLSESTWAQVHEDATQALQVADVGGAVDVDQGLPPDPAKIGNAVGELDHGASIPKV